MPSLRYLDDNANVRNIPLGTTSLTIGRVDSCDITISDDLVSREHSRIDRESDGRYRVRDLASRNKTFVNGDQITETLLSAGDIIRIGDRVLEFVDLDTPQELLSLEFLTPDNTEPLDSYWVKIKSPLNMLLEQVEQLADLYEGLGMTSRPEDIADSVLSNLMVKLQAERGFIAVRAEEKHSLRPIAHRGLLRPVGGSCVPVSRTFVSAALLQKVAGRYPQTAKHIDPQSGYADAAMVAPLTFRGKPVGVVYVDRVASAKPFTSPAQQFLLAAGATTGALMALASRRIADTAVLEEHAWSTAVMKTHNALASVPAGNDTFLVTHKRISGSGRRGDFCDVIHIDDNRSLVVVIDAGGQGLCGMAQASAIRAAFISAAAANPEELELATVFNSLNTMMAKSPGRQLVACAAAICDLPAGKVSYINAGLVPPVLMNGPGRLLTLEQPSLLLGIDQEYVYESTGADMPARFRLVFFTDGLVGAANSSNQTFGEQRVHDLLLDNDVFDSPDNVVTKLMGALDSHIAGGSVEDDATVLVVSK